MNVLEKNIKLKWGIIGAGNIARKMADALLNSPNNYIQAIASKTFEKAKAFADEFNIEKIYTYQEIVEDNEIDIIYVATTHNFHFENANLALNNGKHVLIEKPFTVNAREAGNLIRLARQKNLFLMEAMWTRFLPAIKMLKERIEGGEIGEVKAMNISFGKFISPDYEKRLKDPALAGGVTLDMGIYPISFACYLLGEIPLEIKSMTRFSDKGVDETSIYLFCFPNGCLSTISASYNLNMKTEAMIYGSKGYIEVPDFYSGHNFTIFMHDGTNDIKDKVERVENSNINGFIYQVEEVYRCISEGRIESPLMALDETNAIMKVMDTMRKEWGFRYPFEL